MPATRERVMDAGISTSLSSQKNSVANDHLRCHRMVYDAMGSLMESDIHA